jgi:hypothetical protein
VNANWLIIICIVYVISATVRQFRKNEMKKETLTDYYPTEYTQYPVSYNKVNNFMSIKVVKKSALPPRSTHLILRNQIIESIWEAHSVSTRRRYYAFCLADGRIFVTYNGFTGVPRKTSDFIGKIKSSRASHYPSYKAMWRLETDSGGRLELTPVRFAKISLQLVKKLDGRRNWKQI